MDLNSLAWRKSGRSTNNGGHCVEVAPVPGIVWRKSSRSTNNGGDCVEVASVSGAEWRKSSYTTANGGDCVEVASVSDAVAVRDSKDPQGPALLVSRGEFRRFAEVLKGL
ncbi:DUF397 domain-containing protein [Actinomadura fibrosa]|uniref:DUF397 domain-containing protein n=1 Tax=Actinomadura fibrosa TaxID=111802 RepID=A0ABW2XJX0_9ACTN|nr:DUF397 domain-containing protein [Actinomadura fibrosa]